MQASASAKRDSGAGVFMWIFVKFLRTPFYGTPLGDCFCHYEKTKPFTTKQFPDQALSTSRKYYSRSNFGKRCSMLFMFSR